MKPETLHAETKMVMLKSDDQIGELFFRKNLSKPKTREQT